MSTTITAPITLASITITAPITIGGAAGKSAYQAYLDTTTDDPVLSEAEWTARLSSCVTLDTDQTITNIKRLGIGGALEVGDQAGISFLSGSELVFEQGVIITYNGTSAEDHRAALGLVIGTDVLSATVPVDIAKGGTGATTPSAARVNLGAGATGESLFTAATPAAANVALGVNLYKVASAQNFTNTTPVDVTGMAHTMEANALYKIEGQIQYTSDTGGIFVHLESTAVLSGTAGFGHGITIAAGGTTAGISYNVSVANGYSLLSESAARTGRPITFWLMLATNGSGGVIKLVARKNAATGTNTIIHPQTWFRIEKISP